MGMKKVVVKYRCDCTETIFVSAREFSVHLVEEHNVHPDNMKVVENIIRNYVKKRYVKEN